MLASVPAQPVHLPLRQLALLSAAVLAATLSPPWLLVAALTVTLSMFWPTKDEKTAVMALPLLAVMSFAAAALAGHAACAFMVVLMATFLLSSAMLFLKTFKNPAK
ncbi:hypothetical protein Dxin01_00751 [Deinococcus xinjiangensis]|uniref:Uncharacterized protein n=1 Tax=Deinococcus xinjiangensis TaxID=457454 RepID=A0ABP9VA17_9DEIO